MEKIKNKFDVNLPSLNEISGLENFSEMYNDKFEEDLKKKYPEIEDTSIVIPAEHGKEFSTLRAIQSIGRENREEKEEVPRKKRPMKIAIVGHGATGILHESREMIDSMRNNNIDIVMIDKNLPAGEMKLTDSDTIDASQLDGITKVFKNRSHGKTTMAAAINETIKDYGDFSRRSGTPNERFINIPYPEKPVPKGAQKFEFEGFSCIARTQAKADEKYQKHLKNKDHAI